MKIILLLLLPAFLLAQDDAQKIINKSIKAHGGKKYNEKSFEFDFRDRTYTYSIKDGVYRYTRTSKENEPKYLDVLTNNGFERMVNNKSESLTSKQQRSYSDALNSVVYFAMLPYYLNDAAVKKKYLGKKVIKDITYHKIEITFNKEGGGTDHDDRYVYWFDAADYSLDYLGYSYHVNGGGVRFREAYNTRQTEGVLFQDYVNYKADKDTPVDSLDDLFLSGKLKELSRIELKNIRSL